MRCLPHGPGKVSHPDTYAAAVALRPEPTFPFNFCVGQNGRMDSECRLTYGESETLLDGSPADLRRLESDLASAPDEFTIPMVNGSMTQRRTDNSLLKVSVIGRELIIEGNWNALGMIYDSLTGVASEAESAVDRTVGRHAHIEYLGEDDQWRSPDTFPLVIGADWPTE